MCTLCECMCVSEFVRGCALVCKRLFVCAPRAAVGGGLFIMLCVSPPAKPLLSQHRAPAATALALLPYLSPMGAPIAYSAPQGQYTGAPTETQATITHHNQLNSRTPADRHGRT